jgi:hypothetical protein
VCARSKLPKFDKLWADCTHEESRLVDQQKRLIDEVEALTAQKNKKSPFRKNNKEANSVRVPDKKKDVLKIRCYNCQKLGHFSYDCSQGKGKRKYQAHVAVIQVDIGGHPPIPLGPHHCFFQFFSFLNCSTIYYF